MSWFLLLLTLLLGLSAASINFTTVFEWTSFDFVWPSEDFKKEAERNGNYNRDKILPNEHVIYGERVFISLYNTSKHPSPFTLTWLPLTESSKAPKLKPFPSWIYHEKGNCRTMQQITGMVVDVCGRLWAVDNGNSICPAKLWIFDLTEGDSVSLVHQFTNDTVNHAYKYRNLKSLVLDEKPIDTLAYIPDYTSKKIIVFSLKKNVSWAIEIKGINISSIALSPIKGKQLIYLGSWKESKLFSVPLSDLRRGRSSTSLTPSQVISNKTARSFRMLMDNKGKLYFDLESLNYVGSWDTTAPFKEEIFYKDERPTIHSFYRFKFSFAFDACNNLWILTRRLNESTRCGRNPPSYPSYLTQKYELTTVKPTRRPQTSTTVKVLIQSTAVQVIPTEKPQPKEETPSLLWGLFDVDPIEKSHLILALICFILLNLIFFYIILWLALWVKGLKKTINRTKKDNQEMSGFPSEPATSYYEVQHEQLDEDIYDDVGPSIATASRF
ncbi:protein yellow-like [Cloeon dipterum]|uniref:protein yellow-like n=1 Tax=Cloeon dipterum TaxID=197152 RepID=UPI00321F8BF2